MLCEYSVYNSLMLITNISIFTKDLKHQICQRLKPTNKKVSHLHQNVCENKTTTIIYQQYKMDERNFKAA